MSAFEFSFTFYGLVLGLSVVELIAGVGRLVHDGHRIRVGWLTPVFAVFLVLEVTTFWNQTWAMNQNAPYSFTLLLLWLSSASLFYIAASLVFPREIEEGQDLTIHYWRHRRLVLSLVAAANVLNGVLGGVLTYTIAPTAFWPGTLTGAGFCAVVVAAAWLPRGRLAVVCLVLAMAFDLSGVGLDAAALIKSEPWDMVMPLAGGPPAQ